MPPVFLHFFDWFEHESWVESDFDDPLDWNAVGVSLGERGSYDFYRRQFAYIRDLGVGAIAWEYFKTAPPPILALTALQDEALTLAPFIDLELSYQLASETPREPTLSAAGWIKPDRETLSSFRELFDEFFASVPKRMLARDKNGDVPIFMFGYDLAEEGNPERWSWFANELVMLAARHTGERVKFYWSCKQNAFQEHLFLHHRDHFAAFQFVSDTPQSQFSRDSVTWNLGFDNRYVRRKYGLQRVVRVDPRYIEESAWLAHAADPSLVFIYGWNEPFEGSMVFPTMRWGDAKARLVRHYIQRLSKCREPRLPTALVIIDDLDERWRGREQDWHFDTVRQMLLYHLRLLVPQATLITRDEASASLIKDHELIIDLTVIKTASFIGLIQEARAEKKGVLIADPIGSTSHFRYTDEFFRDGRTPQYAQRALVRSRDATVDIRDDSLYGEVMPGCEVALWADLDDGSAVPLVLKKGNTVFLNSYDYNEEVAASAFSALYGRPLNKSILYGESTRSQRLEQEPDGSVFLNRLERYSINERWSIPVDIPWFCELPELTAEEIDFAFGR